MLTKEQADFIASKIAEWQLLLSIRKEATLPRIIVEDLLKYIDYLKEELWHLTSQDLKN